MTAGRTPAADHADMVASLRQPGACGGFAGGAGLIETHISSLLLAGPRVYKLKKPVALPFVDFSTVERRRAACAQELRLNRRTAPQFYEAVVPVCQGPGGATIAAPGQPPAGAVIDWAVQMRRFDDGQLFSHRADAGTLGAAEVDALAAVVARFQALQSPAPPAFGDPLSTRLAVRQNLAELAALATADASLPALADLQAWAEAQGEALAPLMARRRQSGHVRELHGDLHLGNIVWADGAPVLFDALEFDDRLRHIDTVGDLAFSVMDLHAHGLPRLAWRLVNQWLQHSGDHGGLPLLAWWAVHRASVRAKVSMLSAGASGQLAAAQRARRYLAVARQLAGLDGPRMPLVLVMTCGLSGSGKSVVAAALAERWGAACLRSDVERKRLFGLAPVDRDVPGLYAPDATRRTYQRLQRLAADLLAAGLPVVVDAASLRRSERDAMRAVAAGQGAGFTLLVCQAPTEVLQARVAARHAAGADASDATPAVVTQQRAWAEWPGPDEAADTRVLDTAGPLAEVLARAEAITPCSSFRPPPAGL